MEKIKILFVEHDEHDLELFFFKIIKIIFN